MTNKNSVTLLISVTRRLFLALIILFTVGLVTAFSFPGARYCLPIIVVITGMVGSFVGLQRRLKKLALIDLELFAKSWIYCCLPSLVGGVLALLLYILFLSGLLSGDLFPHFIPNENSEKILGFKSIFEQHAESYKDYAKLLFWCFSAGFSERFVTDIISNFELTVKEKLP